MSLSVDLFWSFRSPYSYLATPRLRGLQREYDVDVNVRVVLPLAVRVEGFFERVNPLWPPYLFRDIGRLAEFHGATIGWPRPDPIVQDFATRAVAPEQPYIHRLSRLGTAAAERGRGIDFLLEVSKIIWDGTVDGWNEGEHLARASERGELDLAEIDREIVERAAHYAPVIEANQTALTDAGHWGVPTMVFDGEPFF